MSKKYKAMTGYKDPRQGAVVNVVKTTFDSEKDWQKAVRLIQNEVDATDLYGSTTTLFGKDSLHITVTGSKKKT